MRTSVLLPTPREAQSYRTQVSRVRFALAGFALVFSAMLLTPAAAGFGDDSGVVAVYSSVSPAYTRTALPGGSFKPETYAFGEGGAWGGSLNDFTIDKLRFLDIAHVIGPTLAGQNYLPGKDPRQTDLLIMVYWGTTSGTKDTSSSPEYQIGNQMMKEALMMPPFMNASFISALSQGDAMIAMANRLRDRQNLENAKVLGYLPEMVKLDKFRGTVFNAFLRQDVVDDVEENRYFVVLLAYDFQTLWKHKQRMLLWETRFSIRERRNDFGKALAAMAQDAARYFGQDSHGLIRKRLPNVNVTIGDPKFMGYEPETKK
jgi:hypothetical protein